MSDQAPAPTAAEKAFARAERDRLAAAPLVEPCPCCAGRPLPRMHPLSRGRLAGPATRPVVEELSADSGGGWRVMCYGCGLRLAESFYKSAEDAAQAWNTRGGVVPPKPSPTGAPP